MSTLALNSSNDIALRGSSIRRVTDGAKVAQMVRSRLLFYKGEWFLDITAGVPYFQDIFTKPVNIGRFENLLKSEILLTEGIESLESFNVDFNPVTREANVDFEAKTVYGEIITEEVFLNV